MRRLVKNRAVGWTARIQWRVLHQADRWPESVVAAEFQDVLLIFPVVVSDPEIMKIVLLDTKYLHVSEIPRCPGHLYQRFFCIRSGVIL